MAVPTLPPLIPIFVTPQAWENYQQYLGQQKEEQQQDISSPAHRNAPTSEQSSTTRRNDNLRDTGETELPMSDDDEYVDDRAYNEPQGHQNVPIERLPSLSSDNVTAPDFYQLCLGGGPHPLTSLFAYKINSLFDLGQATLKSVANNSLRIIAIFAVATAVQQLASIRLPERLITLASSIPGKAVVTSVSGSDTMKLLGLFILVKAALEPLLEKILHNPLKYSTDPLKRKAISYLTPLTLAFIVAKGRGLNVGLASGLILIPTAYSLVKHIENLIYESFKNAQHGPLLRFFE